MKNPYEKKAPYENKYPFEKKDPYYMKNPYEKKAPYENKYPFEKPTNNGNHNMKDMNMKPQRMQVEPMSENNHDITPSLLGHPISSTLGPD
ncbi:MAG: hypothetical protein MRJ93_04955 [Nitrososphaeraceae archaeon]|nr:hypothetical protein [Nitrososphaeraceae archaeon]